MIDYAIMDPKSPEDVKMSNRYPFISADILVSGNSIVRAICEGGYLPPKQPSADEVEEQEKTKTEEKKKMQKELQDLWDDEEPKKDEQDSKPVSQVSLKSNIKNSNGQAASDEK